MIRLVDVVKEFDGKRKVRALDGVSLEIDRGEMVALVGPSGSGKSTLLNLIGTLDRPTSGEIYIDGQKLSGLSDTELTLLRRDKIGFIFQFFNLLPSLTCVENVALPLHLRGWKRAKARERAEELLELVGLKHRLEHLPDELSGGERQRVAIARALSVYPPILLADEPTGALDQASGKEVMGILQRLNAQGRTIVVVTHDANIASYAKRVVELSDGKIVADKAVASKVVSEEEIKNREDETAFPSGQKVCAKCNFGNRAQSKYCANCGFPLQVSERISETIMRRLLGLKVDCPHCGTPNRPFARYCIGCGASMEDIMKAS